MDSAQADAAALRSDEGERKRERHHMGNRQPRQATHQSVGETASQGTINQRTNGQGEIASKEIAEFFRQLTAMRSQPRLRGVSGVSRFDIPEVGSWTVTVNDGEASTIKGAGKTNSVDCVISASAKDFQRILHRENGMNLVTAYLQGLLKIEGDQVFALAVLGSFVLTPGDGPTR